MMQEKRTSLASPCKSFVWIIDVRNHKLNIFLCFDCSKYVAGYRAVVCGMDPVCSESSSWMDNAQVKKLSRGSTQPFYQV